MKLSQAIEGFLLSHPTSRKYSKLIWVIRSKFRHISFLCGLSLAVVFDISAVFEQNAPNVILLYLLTHQHFLTQHIRNLDGHYSPTRNRDRIFSCHQIALLLGHVG